MAYAENLALIVRYDGTKENFEKVKNDYLGKVVFIYGNATEQTTAAGKASLIQAVWVSNNSGGRYLDMANVEYIKNNLVHISGITIDNKSYSPDAGGGNIEFSGTGGITVSVDDNGVVVFDTSSIKETAESGLSKANQVSDSLSKLSPIVNSIQADYLKYKDKTEIIQQLEGGTADSSSAKTVAGAKKYADRLKEDLIGSDDDTIEDVTLKGIIAEVDKFSSTAGVSVTAKTDPGNYAQVYEIKQGTTVVGTINIPKDLVVQSGSVVNGTWSNNTFTENTTGTGKAIKLIIQNQTTPLYINVADLIDVYTATPNADQVQISISSNNVISAKIVEGSVGSKEIANKSVEANKLSDNVNNQLAKINEDLVNITNNTTEGTVGGTGYVSIKLSDGTEKNRKTKNIEVGVKVATMDRIPASGDYLASAPDIKAYLDALFTVRVVS